MPARKSAVGTAGAAPWSPWLASTPGAGAARPLAASGASASRASEVEDVPFGLAGCDGSESDCGLSGLGDGDDDGFFFTGGRLLGRGLIDRTHLGAQQLVGDARAA